ncbi:MAG: 3-phosphoshikimate 1-carboxyvinyltransferase [Flavobacteriales bacterium]|nr:3-phosphoshikimate 1-carboxyvinyltransferase [Flavobacteriales bacterium]
MHARVTVTKPERPIHVAIDLPRSKSIANRALILASLVGDLSLVQNMGDADDTRILHGLLRDRPHVMHCGLGGTTFRFLLAWASVQEGEEHIIAGDARLLERPHGMLVDALRALGADIEKVETGFRVRGRRMKGGEISLDTPMSSQFVSALLLIAPCMEKGLALRWAGLRLSEPYVRMTMKCLEHFNVLPAVEDEWIRVQRSALVGRAVDVELDWSAASFWYEVVALAKNATVELPGLVFDAVGWQGDKWAVQLWGFAVESEAYAKGIRLKPSVAGRDQESTLRHTPDLFQPLALTFAGLGRTGFFHGLNNLQAKETDRIAAVHDALTLLGVDSSKREDRFDLSGSITNRVPPPFDPRGDHRMAMALAPLALVLGSITINDPQVVTKSYPRFWDDLKKAGFGVEFG